MPRVTVDIVDVAFGGDGIAREDGKVIFVEGAVPGETVETQLTLDKKRFAKGRVLNVISPAPDSQAPFCKVFGTCGGCDWQHVAYEKQLAWKASFIESALQKTARIEHPPKISVRPSASLQHFRNRIKLKAKVARGRLVFGYFAKGSHDFVAIDSCPIADESVGELLKQLSKLDFQESLRWQGDMEVQAVSDGQRLIAFQPQFPALSELKKAFPKDHWQPHDAVAFETDNSLTYFTRAGQFQQVNVEGNHALRRWVEAKVESLAPRTLLDLFCGSGNLSLGLKRLDPQLKVWGLEYSETAIQTARDNVKQNKIQDADYRSGPASRVREIFPDLPPSLDCVITDPPRQGMDDSIEDLLSLRPKHILSISCDPNTFARDLKRLMENGYRLEEITGMDFFPHSYHVETVAHLSRD